MKNNAIYYWNKYKNSPAAIKVMLVLVLAVFLILVYHRSSAKDVSMDSIRQAMLKNTDIEKMKKCGNRDLMQFLSLDYSNYDSYLYYKSRESLGVEEVLVVKVKNKDDLDGVKDAVDHRIEAQKKAFDGYGTNQTQLLNSAVVETKGNYLFYCVAENPSTYEEVFRHAVQ